jgi:hypothetical protein
MAVWLLDDEERRDALRREGRDLSLGFYMNYAMNDPKSLSQAARRYDAKLTVGRVGDDLPSAALVDARDRLRAAGRI